MLGSLGLAPWQPWPVPALDSEVGDEGVHGKHLADQDGQDERGRKRQRRSIFFSAQTDSDSDSDDDIRAGDTGLDRLRPDSVHCEIAVVPATPFVANPLSQGTCQLTPSFPRRLGSPCLASATSFVAVYEEPNAGFRSYMEDRSSAMTADGVAYLGVFDGHGGTDASIFLQRHLLPTIQAHLQPGCDVHDALTSAFAATNAAFRATGSIQGSTATTVILKAHRLIAANVGDSPAFVVKKSGEVYSVIQEHKIEGEEAARIASQGVPIYRSPTGPAYMGTPDGTRWLNMSRAFGDFVYPAISCEPHVCSLDVSDGKYLVIGSDGLTEKWPVAEAAQYVSQLAAAGWALPAICRCLVERALARGSTDNISCMVVDLEAYMAMHDAETNSGAEGGDAGMAEGEQDAVEAAATPEGGVAGPAATPEVGLGLEGTEAALCEAEAQPQLPAAGVIVDKEAAADSPVPSRPQHGDGSPEQSSSGAELEAGPSGGQGPNSEAQVPVCEAAPAEALSEGSGAAAKQPTDEVLTSMEELPSA